MTSSWNIWNRKYREDNMYEVEHMGFATPQRQCPDGHATLALNNGTDWKICVPMPKIITPQPIEKRGEASLHIYGVQPVYHHTIDRKQLLQSHYDALSAARAQNYLSRTTRFYDGTGFQPLTIARQISHRH